ncbi:MAG TPA: helicase-related protein [Terriglobia bacterium]|jgi:ATP-dependent helicase HepA
MTDDFHPGQRWISDSEPELGLGVIVEVAHRRVTVAFMDAGVQRQYARANAPLRRVRFKPGDTIRDRNDKALVVESVLEHGGLIVYRHGAREVTEQDLNDSISFDKPEERAALGQFDPPGVFQLRASALQHQHDIRKSKVRGFAGGRIDLIPHQLYIASEVASRLAPRVLLADEVGLGKTIEACLILHRLILTARVQRVLVLVPESLVHQWFIELLRRFNLWFHIFDEARCKDIEKADPGANPFLDDQLILCSINLLTGDESRGAQAIDAGWDVLVVDEAHHLSWSPDHAAADYLFIETLSRKTPGLLLLTATPEQLGIASHFGRMRLLDPDRFHDLDAFIKETGTYREVAREADQLKDAASLNALLDRHGTGRVSFRNTRSTITGFPARRPHLIPLTAGSSKHERLDWLAALVRGLDPDKILLICRTPAMVTAIETALRERVKNLRAAVFHEGLSLIQRDRNAAWFADKHGATILLCSEIGSEGRNFQFAHHLVLYDLPLDPELLEQRIGRLDRIGQKHPIDIHVPFVTGSGQEVLARWYHEGLNAFTENLQGGPELLETFGARVYDLTHKFHKGGAKARAALDGLIQETRTAYREIAARLREGRDRLLELNSFRPKEAERLIEEIHREDEDRSIDRFMLAVFDQYSIDVEELAPRTYKLGSAGVFADSFPGLPAEGLTVTADRQRALVREDLQFLTWDHPLVTGALDLLLGSEKGNSSFVASDEPKSLEAVYVLECIAPPQLHIDRFLPPTPIRVVVQGGEIEKAESMASAQVPPIVEAARRQMNKQLSYEIERLEALRKVNPSVRAEEIHLLQEQRRMLDENLNGARLRLDALQLKGN